MTAWGRPLGLLLGCVLLTPPAYGAGERPAPSTRLFAFTGDDVFESSGLVDRGSTVYTVNDSGDDAVVYGVDTASGRTVSRTTYADSVQDVEAVAPGRNGSLWVGDIGDNRERRDDVTVHRVLPRDGESDGTAYTLTYPDGPRDAEALLVHPRTERLFVVSKSAFGGTVYVTPGRPRDGGNRLRAFARVSGLVTDGSFFPDGRRVVLRTYETASVYTYPAFELVGSVRLPRQRQGEGVAVSPTGRVLVSTEGVRAEVREVTLPASLRSGSAGASGSPPGPPPSTRAPSRAAHPEPPPRSARDWVGIGAVAAGVGLLGYLSLRASRLRGPRRP